jgi:hypothetical protein
MSRHGVQVPGFFGRRHCSSLRLLEPDSAHVSSTGVPVAFTHDRDFNTIGAGGRPSPAWKELMYQVEQIFALLISPHLPGNMCYLQETIFSCRSVHKSLFMACKYAERMTRTTDVYAPRFCSHGCEIVKSITVDATCGSSNGGGCLQAKFLAPLLDRRSTVGSQFASYAKRIFSIKVCSKNGKRPIYNFHQVSQEGWDAKQHQKRVDSLWNKSLPWKRERLVPLFENSRNEITAVYTLTTSELLREHDGVGFSAYKVSALRTPIHEETLLIAPDCNWSDEVVYAIRRKLRDDVFEMELQALEACMDDVGWMETPLRRGRKAKLGELVVISNSSACGAVRDSG